jgi:ABC-type transport system substrate-binding protein
MFLRPSRVGLWFATLLLTIALMSPACGPTEPPTDRIVIGTTEDIVSLWPMGVRGRATVNVLNCLFSRLVSVDSENELYGDLAETVPTLDNGGAVLVGKGGDQALEVTFKVRPALFGDGQPVTSRDVRFT